MRMNVDVANQFPLKPRFWLMIVVYETVETYLDEERATKLLTSSEPRASLLGTKWRFGDRIEVQSFARKMNAVFFVFVLVICLLLSRQQ